MRSTFAMTAIGLIVIASAPRAGQPPTPPPIEAPQLPKGTMPNLGRPTEASDKTPLFDFGDYFTGTWAFEWVVPDSPLGPAGQIAGTTTFKAVGGRFYSSETTAKGPVGPIRIRERIAYHKENRTIVRHVTDSRGFSYMLIAPVGSDLGGFYYLYFEGEPFTHKGKTIRIKENWRLPSPVNYRVSMTLSTEAGPFANYGNPWWRKQVPGIK
ncbi:MAG: hypothetical protein A3H97_23900 [Acidobacteria bacterium RIFCSPLOWO2_02_FULL_65_29]|nr:MAG: hypothetical protein A3H97_23900 [Acidobacteria bacterium RIFCSPLOWO2_02_FULL_65_29]